MCSFSDNLGWLFAFAFRSANSSSVFASWARTGSSFPATRSSIGVAGAASWVGDGNGHGLMAALDCLGSELGSGVGGVSMMSMGTVARKRVVYGKSASVCVDLGGRRNTNNKTPVRRSACVTRQRLLYIL